MIELYILEQLDAFARDGTLSGAARELHVTQPAITRSMKKLEEETGLTLFDREGRKISLNEGGKLAARYAARILEQEEEMTRELARWNRSQKTVSIGSCASLPISRLMPALQLQFTEKTIVTEICEDDDVLLDRLKAGDLQLVILHEKPVRPGIFSQRYIHENICLFVPPDHPLAARSAVTIDDLRNCNILVERHIGFWLPLVQQLLPASNLLLQDSIDALDELAESSSTAMFNSDAMIRDGYESGNRITIPIDDSRMHAVYYVACLESRKENLRVLFNAVRAEALRDI